jgi:hypothetical protein
LRVRPEAPVRQRATALLMVRQSSRGADATASGVTGSRVLASARGCFVADWALSRGVLHLPTAGPEQKPQRPRDRRTTWPPVRESSSELMIDRSLASRAVRMQLTGHACLGKTPACSDCPVALVLAICGEASRLQPETCNAVGAGITYSAYDTTAAMRSGSVDYWFVRTLCPRGETGRIGGCDPSVRWSHRIRATQGAAISASPTR